MFSAKQMEVFKFPYEKEYDYLICDGAIRAGKTSSMFMSFILWSMSTFNRKNFIICGKTVTGVERNIIRPLEAVTYMQNNFSLNYLQNIHCLIVRRGNKENYYYCFGGTDESSYKPVQGLTAAGAFVDEVALMPESFVNQVVARCSVRGSKIMFNCNPEEDSHWFYLKWVLKAKEKKAKHLHWSLEDNPSLDQNIIDRYKRSYTGVFYKRYIDGIWCKAEGLIYNDFANNNEKYLIDEDKINKDDIWFIEVGTDFGNNLSAHTFVATAYLRNYEGIIVVEESKIAESITPNQLDNEFVLFVNKVYSKYKMPFIVNCDNAETTLINGFKLARMNNNLPCDVQNAMKKPIKDRIMFTCRMFAENKIKINRNCENMIQAFNNATWDDKKPDTRLDNVGHYNPVDMLDAFEYSTEKHIDELMITY